MRLTEKVKPSVDIIFQKFNVSFPVCYSLLFFIRLDDLEYENDELRCENYQLKSRHVNNNKKRFTTNNNNNQLIEMQRAIGKLERSVIGERKTHNRLVEQLRNEKINLHKEVERLRNNVRVLKVREQELNDKHR